MRKWKLLGGYDALELQGRQRWPSLINNNNDVIVAAAAAAAEKQTENLPVNRQNLSVYRTLICAW